jgi:acyl-CoA thioesterase
MRSTGCVSRRQKASIDLARVTTFSELLASAARGGHGALSVAIPANWMQGRTTYGGLTAALCLQAAKPLADSKPIRSAQIAFVGPTGGEVTATPLLLRSGKNATFVSVRMTGSEGVVAEAIFAFGAPRQSQLGFVDLPAPQVLEPRSGVSFFRSDGPGPAFARNFELQLMAGGPPVSGAAVGDFTLWMRHRDPAIQIDDIALLGLADVPPPAVMPMLKTPGPLSSMTWMAEFLTDEIATQDGWFLARHFAQNAHQGYSSQAMQLWNQAGQAVMIGRQTIAIFA